MDNNVVRSLVKQILHKKALKIASASGIKRILYSVFGQVPWQEGLSHCSAIVGIHYDLQCFGQIRLTRRGEPSFQLGEKHCKLFGKKAWAISAKGLDNNTIYSVLGQLG